jgi:hypothetical protein
LCLPMGTHSLPIGRSEDFGGSPFFGSSSDESALSCMWRGRDKEQ